VFLGSTSGIASGNPATAAARLVSNQRSAAMGFSVSGAGYVDDDDYADVIVGAHSYNVNSSCVAALTPYACCAGNQIGSCGDAGAAFVFPGSPSGVADGSPLTAAAKLESDQAGARLGSSVSSAGDVNADGFDDVIVGAKSYNAGTAGEGAAFVFLGSPSGIADATGRTPQVGRLSSGQQNATLGHSVSGAGDVNGDGYADVIVGAPLYDKGETDEGAAFVFLGNSNGAGLGPPEAVSSEEAVALPEPGSALSLAAGLSLLALLDRRRRRAKA